MIGKHTIRVFSKKINFEITVRRNITVIRGDSATGKSWFADTIRRGLILSDDEVIRIDCDVNVSIVDPVIWMQGWIPKANTIYVLDEDCKFMKSDKFARMMDGADFYIILITRENIVNLPYSINEIYHANLDSGTIHFYPEYTNKSSLGTFAYTNGRYSVNTTLVITEDGGSGFDFFEQYTDIQVVPAGGKSKISNIISEFPDRNIVIVADGAALGPDVSEILRYGESGQSVILLAPESFEWLILKSGVVDFLTSNIKEVLQNTENYADSKLYLSWERFFTQYLKESIISNASNKVILRTYKYIKSKLNPTYCSKSIARRIFKQLDTTLITEGIHSKNENLSIVDKINQNAIDVVKTNHFSK